MTRILIADDHEVVRSGLRSIIEDHAGWSVVAEAADGKDAIAKAIATKPDVAILDHSPPLSTGSRPRAKSDCVCQASRSSSSPCTTTRTCSVIC